MPTRAAAAAREASRLAYNTYLASCPSRDLLAALSDKWVVLVLTTLSDGPRRYSEIGRQIAGVSQKMLTQTLRSLERNGLIARSVAPTVPVTVTYRLTELGHSLVEVVRGLKAWAEENIDAVRQARGTYDASAGQREPQPAPGARRSAGPGGRGAPPAVAR